MWTAKCCSRLTVEHEEKQEDQEEQVDEDYKHITLLTTNVLRSCV